MEEQTELEQSRNLLSKEVVRIDAYERLSLNPDFQIFRKELIDDKIDPLFDLSQDADEQDKPMVGIRIRGQIEALRGIQKIFKFVLDRKGQVNERLQGINKIK